MQSVLSRGRHRLDRVKNFKVVVLGTMAFAHAACGGDELVKTPDGHAVSDPVTYSSLSADEICPALIRDTCRAVFLCPNLGTSTNYLNEEQCRQDLPCRGLANLQTELSQGSFTWDAERAASCQAHLSQDVCTEAVTILHRSLQDALASCPELPTIPLNAEGERCLSSLSCAAGTYCPPEDCAAVCTAAQPDGSPCGFDRDCASNTCEKQVCGAAPRIGEECPSHRCQEGAECERLERLGPYLCLATQQGALGDACHYDWDCADGRNCLHLDLELQEPSFASKNGVCADPVESGGNCTWTSDCVRGLTCRNGQCGRASQYGEACEYSLPGVHNCAPGFICSFGYCKITRYWGESCGGGQHCAESNCENDVCVPRQDNGDTCEWNSHCRSDYCEAGTCRDSLSCQP